MVEDPPAFPIRPGQSPIAENFDIGADKDLFLDIFPNFPGQIPILPRVTPLSALYLEGHGITAVLPSIQHDLVFASNTTNTREDMVHLARIDIHRPENEHIIRAAQNPVMTRE